MPEPEYDFDVIESYGDADPPVIDVLIKSWLDQLDYVYGEIQTTGLRYKLESAVGSDLDDIWGRIFQIKRYSLETDLDYRARLIVHTKILMGSGTIPNCEAIIDSLLGEQDATEIESRWPGIAHVEFKNVFCMQLAKAAESKITKILPIALAAGMTYEMILPIADYDISLILKANGSAEYDLAAHCQVLTYTDYDISAKLVLPRDATYDITAHVQNEMSRQYSIHSGLLKVLGDVDYTADLLIELIGTTAYTIDSRLKKDRSKDYTIDSRLKKDFLIRYYLSSYLQRVRPKFYGLSANIEAET